MTSTDSKFKRDLLKRPFATGRYTPKTPISTDGTGRMSFQNGFSSDYTKSVSNGGIFLSRADMNSLGNLASHNQFYINAGGLRTFDREFARKNGGYPRGAILDYVAGNVIYKVRSLKDNNMVDFRGFLPSEEDDGIVCGEIDGVNWTRVNEGEIEQGTFVCKLQNKAPVQTMCLWNIFKAERSGVLECRGTYDTNATVTYSLDRKSSSTIGKDALKYWANVDTVIGYDDKYIAHSGAGLFIQDITNGTDDKTLIWKYYDYFYPNSIVSKQNGIKVSYSFAFDTSKLIPFFSFSDFGYQSAASGVYNGTYTDGTYWWSDVIKHKCKLAKVEEGHTYSIFCAGGLVQGTTTFGELKYAGDPSKSAAENIDMEVYIV